MKEPQHEPFLTPGNSHVGPDIWCFSIPAFSTCPGATLACLLVCYALEFLFYVETNLQKHKRNWERALDDPGGFSRDMTLEIKFLRAKKVRIHVAGDFFSVKYIKAWLRVAKACRNVRFLFYTRSWRVPELRPALIELASLPNVRAIWSEDRLSGACDIPVGRRAFLCTDAEDEAFVPRGVLVFRHKPRKKGLFPVRKWINGSWVCAKEQGTPTKHTCTTCGVCLDPIPWPTAPEDRRREDAGGTEGRQIPVHGVTSDPAA